jgi:hypothetical protein
MPPKNCCHCWQPEDVHSTAASGCPAILWIIKTGLTVSGYAELDALPEYEALQLNAEGQRKFCSGDLPLGWESLPEDEAADGFVFTSMTPWTWPGQHFISSELAGSA